METAALLLRGFICDQIGSMAKYIAELALERVAQAPYIKPLLEVLKRIAQEMDKDEELQRMIETDNVFTAEVFVRFAREIFSDGINWGRVAVLFCLASKLVLKALCTDMRELITTIMDWTLDFIRKRLLPWIQEQGGWGGLLSQHSDKIKWLAVAVAVAIIGTAALAVFRVRTISG
ncbi:apoptosis regulator BAX-like [Talpa occidentalis]|uniref:apoptosis regulator BAX-like n=1 Tax=Talpa occidentalis TaxID=50954 RepID=UPI0023F8F2DF|nr:apoptosis regulator BAX-like [Talpa occidentalis]